MNPLYSYSLKSLKKNRARTIVTIIGIMMSAGLITALATLGSSMYRYMQEGYIAKSGDWHIGITGADKQEVEDICGEPGVENPFRAISIGYADVDTKDPDRPYLYLKGVEPDYFDHMPLSLTEGRLPEKEGEILLPEAFRKAAPEGREAGDVLPLEVGLRLEDGQALWQDVPYGYGAGGSFKIVEKETLGQTEAQSYTIAGFYEAPESGGFRISEAPGYEAYVWWDGNGQEDGYGRFSLWYQVSEVGNQKFHEMYDRMRLVYGYMGQRISVNLGLLSLYGVRISNKGESAAVAAVAAILLFIILIGSVMLIYNAFAISVGERTRQFGLLSSLGATRKQIRRSVLCEAAIVSGVGTLAGVGVGIALVAVLLQAAGETAASMMEFPIRPRLYIWLPAVLFAMLLAMLTVLVSAWIPAWRATRITAIEAIRQSREFHYSGKQKKTAGWVERLFGLEGMLAVTYSRRNRKRYRVTTFALFLSMVLFVSINTFSDDMMTVLQAEYKTSNYDILVQLPQGGSLPAEERKKILEALRRIEGVESVAQNAFIAYSMPPAENAGHVTDGFQGILEDASGTGRNRFASIAVTDNQTFSDFCREHGLEEERFLNPDQLTVIVKNEFKAADTKGGNSRLLKGLLEGDGIFYADMASTFDYRDDYKPDIKELKAGYFAESLAPGCNSNWGLSIMLPESVAESLGLLEASENFCSFFLNAADHRRAAEAAEMLLEKEYADVSVYDQAQRQAGNRNLVFLLRFLSNVFIVMIAAISMANVFSTISNSLKLRQKEFAMLKTVGMTQRGLRSMMNMECLMYGGKAILFGLPVSVLASAVMYYYFRKDVVFDYHLPIQSILIAAGSIFAVVFATMLYTMGRMKRENVIDVLKQESF